MTSKATSFGNSTRRDLENILASCRICLIKTDDPTDIFASGDFVRQIEFCTGILVKPDINLPTKICNNCYIKLTVAYKFKETFLQAENVLREINSVKLEQCDTENKIDVDVDIKYEVIDLDEYSDGCVDDSVNDTVKVETSSKRKPKNGVRKSGRIKEKAEKSVNVGKAAKLQSLGKKKSTKIKKKKRMLKLKFKKLFCQWCNVEFKDSEESKIHRKEVHDKGLFICEHCGLQFTNRATHYSHVKAHEPPRFGCSICDYKSTSKQATIKHMRIHTGIKQFRCEFCTAAYYNMGNLQGHIRRCHSNPEPRLQCPICERRFHDKTKLNRHIDSHNEIKRFQCEHCHSAFTRRCYWKKHLLQQHNIEIPAQRPGRTPTTRLIDKPNSKIVYITKEEVLPQIKVDNNKDDEKKVGDNKNDDEKKVDGNKNGDGENKS